MKKSTKNQNKDESQIAEKKLKNINIFFSAYGSFLTGLFCIFQYFFNQYDMFSTISFFSALLILGITYFLAYSKWVTKFETFWRYVSNCANAVGILNPVMLAISIMLSVSQEIELLLICIVMSVGHLILYAMVFSKYFYKIIKHVFKLLANWCKNNVAPLITALFAIASFLLWFFSTESRELSDLWLNLLAGFISSLLTIAVIDRMIKSQKTKNERPIRLAMYRDIQLFTSRFIDLWQEMYVQSVENRSAISINQLFEIDNINSIRDNLNLEGFPNIAPPQNWFVYIDSCRRDLVERGEKIINSYVSIADPEVIQSIHYLINDSFLIGNLRILQNIHSYDIANHIPRPTLLSCYMPAPSECDIKMISQLFDWCRTQYDKLHSTKKQDLIDIYPITTQVYIINPSTLPTSIMKEETKRELFEQYSSWQEQNKK